MTRTMKIKRREFVKLSGLGIGGLSLTSNLSWAFPHAAEPRHISGKRIVILGAGLAGLSAGWELHNAGHDVTILEAQLHPGGRAHTIRDGLSDDLYAEAGAARIPAVHSITLEWVKHFGLELEPFRPTQLSEVALLKGKRVRIPPDKPVDMAQVPLDLTPEERRVGLDDLEEHYCGELMRKIGFAIREDWPPEMMRLTDLSIEDFLHQRGASVDAIHYMLAGFEPQSALDYIRDDGNHYKQPKSKIKGGTDLLPRAFAAKLTEVIRYGCVVEHIERGQNRVRIACRHAGMLDHVEAEAVICTIPFGVLRHISVTPEWTSEKRKVIDGVYYMAVVRTTFHTSRCPGRLHGSYVVRDSGRHR
jgi:monoamine oxidase